MERCLEDLIIRMIYLMTCRKGLSIYPLLLFVVVINKEQSHCCENDKEHSELVGHHLLDCLFDAMYDPFYITTLSMSVSSDGSHDE
jgi:hypothetical protein